jgi:uncharacterized protein YqjF (DUF2071 family)
MSVKPFLTAEWLQLAFANYIVDPAVLASYIPAKTEIDFCNNKCFVSLVGFMFSKVRVKGIRIPLHTDFPEVNLRFYVRHRDDKEWKRGVVFVKEIVPKPAISFVANTFFNERYATLPMMNNRKYEAGKISVSYSWKKGGWNSIAVTADQNTVPLMANTEEEFITQHFWGYSSGKGHTWEYHVSHPAWNMHPVRDYKISCDFGKLYGDNFSFLANQQPDSVFLANGSAVEVYNKRII